MRSSALNLEAKLRDDHFGQFGNFLKQIDKRTAGSARPWYGIELASHAASFSSHRVGRGRRIGLTSIDGGKRSTWAACKNLAPACSDRQSP